MQKKLTAARFNRANVLLRLHIAIPQHPMIKLCQYPYSNSSIDLGLKGTVQLGHREMKLHRQGIIFLGRISKVDRTS